MTRHANQQVQLAAIPEADLKPTHFRVIDADMPAPRSGEVLLETTFLSIDPYMRFWMRQEKSYYDPIQIGQVMPGATVSRVCESKNADWPEGMWVLGFTGWQRYSISNGQGLRRIDPSIAPPSTALGVLGMTGFTAYAGLRNIGQPKPGETVVVAAASGGVGSAVGQIARIRGARAVGITTGTHKLSYVKDELGFDSVVDYRAPDFAEQLARATPNGIDVYFENVGGHVWDTVLPLLNDFARVPVCGLISQYETSTGDHLARDRLAHTMTQVMGKSLTLRGFIQTEFAPEQTDDFLREAAEWFASGKLRHREHLVDGLEAAPNALIDQLRGQNFGKVIVRV